MPQSFSLEEAFGGGSNPRFVDPATQAARDAYASQITGGGRVVDGMMQGGPNDVSDEAMPPEVLKKNQAELEAEIARTKDPEARKALVAQRGYSIEDAFGDTTPTAAIKGKSYSLLDAFPPQSQSDSDVVLGGLKAAGEAVVKKGGTAILSEFATIGDMILGIIPGVGSSIAELGYRAAVSNDPKISQVDAAANGRQLREYILGQTAPEWFTKVLHKFSDPGEEPTASNLAEAMNYIQEKIDQGGKKIDLLTGGKINKDDVSMFANGFMNLFGAHAVGLGKGSKPNAATPPPPGVEPTLPWQSVAEETKAATDPGLHADYAATVGKGSGTTLPTDPLAGPGRAAVGSTPSSPVASVAEKNAVLPPQAAVAARGEAVKSARAAMPDDTQWAQYLKDYAEGETKAAGEAVEGDAKIPTADELMAEIKATPETAAEKVAPVVEAPFSNKAAKAILVAGGAGAALAYAYGGDKEKDLSLAALGAGLFLSGGREAIAKMSPDSSMAALREASPTTLKVLEEIPGGWKDVPIKWLNDQLKRTDVTKPEKDIFNAVLSEWKNETHISAKELMVDLKEAMGDFELTPKRSGEYDTYGFEYIDRYMERGKEGPDGDIGWSSGEEPKPGDIEVEGTSTVWQVPRETTRDLNSNHFGDPNYFGHTRSFMEKNVKHVVEIQSDLAQKGQELTIPQRAELTSSLEVAENRYKRMNGAVENLRDFFRNEEPSIEKSFEKFKKGLDHLRHLIWDAPGTLAQRYEVMIASRIGNADYYATNVRGHNALRRAANEFMEQHPGETPPFVQLLEGLADSGDIGLKEAKNYAAELSDAFSSPREEARLRIEELKTKLAPRMDISHLDPMMKNWAKRLVREELAASARQWEAMKNTYDRRMKQLDEFIAQNATHIDVLKSEGWEKGPIDFAEKTQKGWMEEKARLEKGPPAIVRFATADTVAKVENWQDFAKNRRADAADLEIKVKAHEQKVADYKRALEQAEEYYNKVSLEYADSKGVEPIVTRANETVGRRQENVRSAQATLEGLKADLAGAREVQKKVADGSAGADLFDAWAKRMKREDAWSRNGVPMQLADIDAAKAKVERKIATTKAVYEKVQKQYGKVFENPEHAGIYDRYATDVEKFLKQLGAKDYTDPKGHTWLEVPFKPGSAARRAQMFGGADLKTMVGIAAVGMGIAAGMYLNKKNPIEGAVYGAIAAAVAATGGISRAIKTLQRLNKPDPRIRINDLTEHREYNEKTAAVAIWQAQNEILKLLPKKADRVAVHEALDAGTAATLVGKQKQAADLAERFYSALSVLTKEIDVDRMGTKDLAEVVGIYGTAVARNIANKMFLTELKAATDPNGRPLVFGIKKAPKDFVLINNPLLQGVRVNPDLAPSLKFMFEAQEPGAVIAALSTVNSAIKRNAVSASLFHSTALLHAALGAMNPVTALKIVAQAGLPRAFGENAYLKQLRTTGSRGIIGEAIRDGLVFSLERAEAASEDTGAGFYRGMASFQRALDKAIPGLHLGLPLKLYASINHAVDNFMWGRLHASYKLQTYAAKREALVENASKAGRPITDEAAGRIAAAYANDIFGGLNWQRLAEGVTTRWGRDIALAAASPAGRRGAQLALFAPDWTLSTTRAFTQAVTKDLKNVPSGLFSAKSIGDLHRQQLLRSALYYLAVGDTLNYAFTGHHIWDKEQKDWTRIELGDGRSMQLSKHFNEPFHWFMHPAQQALNKLAYGPKEFFNQALTTEYLSASGHMKPMDTKNLGRLRHAIKGMTPIGMQQFQDGGTAAGVSGMLGYPIYGQTEEQKRKERLEKALERYRQSVGVQQ